MIDTKWLQVAFSYKGIKEIVGSEHNAVVIGWLSRLKAWWRDDETPWCGVFVAACLQEAEVFVLPRYWMRARDWLNWGRVVPPCVGAVCVIERGPTSGHVFFAVGKDQAGRIIGIGGNQGNAVTLAPFEASRVLGWRMPADYTGPHRPLPVLTGYANMTASSAEA